MRESHLGDPKFISDLLGGGPTQYILTYNRLEKIDGDNSYGSTQIFLYFY